MCVVICAITVYFSTDLTITTSRLMELFQSVNDSRTRIGLLLGLSDSKIVEIQRSFRTASQRKEAYFDAYTHHHPCPSWRKVVEVLQRYDLYQEAGEVENTYVEGMHGVDRETRVDYTME